MHAFTAETENRTMSPHAPGDLDDGDPPSDNFPVLPEHSEDDDRTVLPGGVDVAELLEELRELRVNDEVRHLLEAAGVFPDPVKIRALAALDTAQERQALLETWPVSAGRKPRSVSAAAVSGRTHQLPADSKSFAMMIR